MNDSVNNPSGAFRNCRDLESTFSTSKCKCAHYREYFPDCACELVSVSEHSPGIVQNEEIIVRAVYDSGHLEPNGRLKPAYFRDSMGNRALSVDRMLYINKENYVAQKRKSDQFTEYLGFVASRCGDLRTAYARGGRRLFAVYDSAISKTRHMLTCVRT